MWTELVVPFGVMILTLIALIGFLSRHETMEVNRTRSQEGDGLFHGEPQGLDGLVITYRSNNPHLLFYMGSLQSLHVVRQKYEVTLSVSQKAPWDLLNLGDYRTAHEDAITWWEQCEKWERRQYKDKALSNPSPDVLYPLLRGA